MTRTPTTTTPPWQARTALRISADTGQAWVDLELIAPHEANVRRELGDLTDLVASILEQGIIEPLIVAPHPDGDPGFVVVAGHRRLAAAQQAVEAEVPVIVRPDLDTEAKVIEAMLTENLHRDQLTPVEEADGYQRLALFDYTPVQIAKKVGRSETTVRRRLQLAALPDGARDALHAGQITLHQADEIAQVVKPDDDEAVKQLTKAVGKGDNELKLELDRLRRRAEFEGRLQEQIDVLGGYGVATVLRVSSGQRAEGWERGRFLGPEIDEFLAKVDAGDEETPEAMIVETWQYSTPYWYTATPTPAEPTGDGTPAVSSDGDVLPGQRSVDDELAAQREARERAEREQRMADLEAASEIRDDWLEKLLTKRVTPVQVATMLRQCVADLASSGSVNDEDAALAGLDPDVDWGDPARLRAHADTLSTPALVQLLWGLFLYRPSLIGPGSNVETQAAWYLPRLQELGYELTSVEAALIEPIVPDDQTTDADAGEDAGT
ncbi:ParB/RepB/Spo0J family partition protein [Jiangella alkaliphila]|uniref:ParB-like nuclease domain-containing protein n=1 Tax=Jiangella alkaliphila TaxID=419479 RepID=A0A1H2IE39_9ACTN|nr:ParB/RepB/Spo0J family partition protein [Jiangella alkaliphila]SDU42251.1 ParB-like nuclease domain-containing protein [Jiangella alkaliphila]